MSLEETLQQLEHSLEKCIECNWQICIMVSDFPPQGQLALQKKLQDLVENLQEIDNFRPNLEQVQVPVDILEYIDNGLSPEEFTKDCLENAKAMNEAEREKINRYRMFRAHLLLEFTKVFPRQAETYRALRETVNVLP